MVFEQAEEKIQIPLAISQCLVSDLKQPTVLIDARSPSGKRKILDYEKINVNKDLNVFVLCWIGDTHFLRKQLCLADCIFLEVVDNYREKTDYFFQNCLPWRGGLVLILKNSWIDKQMVRKSIHLRYRIAKNQVWIIRNVEEIAHMIKENLKLLSDFSQEGRNYEGII